MRILHILNHTRKTGNGIVNVAVDLACLQAQAGHHVAVAAIAGDYRPLLEQYGVECFELDQTRYPLRLLTAAGRYYHLIRSFQPEIVHAHMMTGLVLAKLLQWASGYGLVSTVHNEFQPSAVLMGWADRVIGVSRAVADAMAQRGVPARKLRVVANGTLGSPRTQPLSSYTPKPLQRPAIATVAGLYERKGITELIAAFSSIAAEFPTAHLYLIGNGPDRPLFETQAGQTGVADRIHFEGFQVDPQRYLLATDVFVLASRQEPFALALCEAREAGCAIIASNVDGIPEALEHGKAGVLVPPRSPEAIASALRQLLSQPQQLASWKVQAQSNLGWLMAKRVSDETLAIYRELKPARLVQSESGSAGGVLPVGTSKF